MIPLEFYRQLSPFYLLQKSSRDFSENLVLNLWLVIAMILFYRITIAVVAFYSPANDASVEYNRRKNIRTVFIFLNLIIGLPIFFMSLEYLPTLLGFAGAVVS